MLLILNVRRMVERVSKALQVPLAAKYPELVGHGEALTNMSNLFTLDQH